MKKSTISSFFFPVQHLKYPPLSLSSLTKAEWVIQWNICCIHTRLYTHFFLLRFQSSFSRVSRVESTSLHQYTESHSSTPRDGWSFEFTRTHTEEAPREAVCRKVLKKMYIYWQRYMYESNEATCAPPISKNLHYAFLYLDLYYVHIHREIFSFQLLNTLTFDNETHWAIRSKTHEIIIMKIFQWNLTFLCNDFFFSNIRSQWDHFTIEHFYLSRGSIHVVIFRSWSM